MHSFAGVAAQSDYLRGAIASAINFPSITAEEAPKLKPFIALAGRFGSFAGQFVDSEIKRVAITYVGEVAQLNTKALTALEIAGPLRPLLAEVSIVSASRVAKEGRIAIDEGTRAADTDYQSLITVSVATQERERSDPGTYFTMESRASLISNLSAAKSTRAPPSSDGNAPEPICRRLACQLFAQTVANVHRAARETAAEPRDILQKKNCGAGCTATKCSAGRCPHASSTKIHPRAGPLRRHVPWPCRGLCQRRGARAHAAAS